MKKASEKIENLVHKDTDKKQINPSGDKHLL
jgi:hypothetical protein